ncbi:putative glycolipid-binding domain-containing protein [Shouchella clausii]|jgi:uncharacterized protein|uniref:Glycolipid-binding domain-containing protein n=1 Tax=Shouchella clausii TaxID=79880 RepID=A0A268S0M9_SHOCL|nr:putative glycolipid-binding domain-containing protein [Shouchella clausii]PAD43185.1 hypothetical protein CHH54_08015 [Bacillus sp. 7520-S]SPT81041.1 Uncharacterized protein conserved in bacteria [Niallia circulans]AST96619.1 hypothetical protein BC8716_11925 [Shouchella clausii]MBU8596615.1 putative glycolipid-binding domain-containing protein [Shouchella clausii]MCM3549987.1 putative glycolipid-binding domain-containing protein [Shouchella clausii]
MLYIWENIEHKGLEYLKVKYSSNNISVTSTIIDPLESNKIEYEVILTRNWNFIRLKLTNDKLKDELLLSKDSNGKWLDGNNIELDHLVGANDIDLSCTPFTNTLPINRCDWTKDEPLHLEMVFIDASNLNVKKTQQTYRLINNNLTNKVFNYSSGSFESVILVNNNGFVLDYPGYFNLLTHTNEC